MKGGDFEREFSKRLSIWFSGRDDVFWHTTGSGARATSRRKTGKDTEGQHGDIFATCEEGKPLECCWSIELKSGYHQGKSSRKLKDKDGAEVKVYSRWDILDLIDSTQKDPIINQFWDQAKRDAELSNRIPVLVFRRNMRTACICFSRSYFGELVDMFGYPNAIVIQVSKRICILPLKDFFEWIEDIRPILKKQGIIEKRKVRR
jgi:hypothetical protein